VWNDIRRAFFHWSAIIPFCGYPLAAWGLQLNPILSFIFGLVIGSAWMGWRMRSLEL
jgi:hypothetical protein